MIFIEINYYLLRAASILGAILRGDSFPLRLLVCLNFMNNLVQYDTFRSFSLSLTYFYSPHSLSPSVLILFPSLSFCLTVTLFFASLSLHISPLSLSLCLSLSPSLSLSLSPSLSLCRSLPLSLCRSLPLSLSLSLSASISLCIYTSLLSLSLILSAYYLDTCSYLYAYFSARLPIS